MAYRTKRSTFAACVLAAAIAMAMFAPQRAWASEAQPQNAPSISGAEDVEAVKSVLAAYNVAIQKLDVTGTETLFTADSEIIESGGVEGTYAYYLEHHIGPELEEFKSFSYKDYKIDVRVDGAFAFATESFGFRIEPKNGEAPVERLGVATSVLVKSGEGWKIFRYHWSSHRPETN